MEESNGNIRVLSGTWEKSSLRRACPGRKGNPLYPPACPEKEEGHLQPHDLAEKGQESGQKWLVTIQGIQDEEQVFARYKEATFTMVGRDRKNVVKNHSVSVVRW